MSGDLYALDFDGVLCDSCGELSISAIMTAKMRWPEPFKAVDSSTVEWIVDNIYVARPVIEVGYEYVLLARVLLEMRIPSVRTSQVSVGLTMMDILDNWVGLRPSFVKEWNENPKMLSDLFEKVRAEWMKEDVDGWMRSNRFYPDVAAALNFASSKLYIITANRRRFADTLLRDMADVEIPLDRICGPRSGSKVNVLKQLQKKAEHMNMTLHFVDERLSTLKKVMEVPELERWNLYFAVWGYSSDKEKEEAEKIPRIHTLQLSEFTDKLK